jgi:hypothetical protein
MEEARYSVNIKFNLEGFDTQITLREEERSDMLLKKMSDSIVYLKKIGATPERRWEVAKNGNGRPDNGNGKPNGEPQQPTNGPAPCHKCGSNNVKLIKWERNNKPRPRFGLRPERCSSTPPPPPLRHERPLEKEVIVMLS